MAAVKLEFSISIAADPHAGSWDRLGCWQPSPAIAVGFVADAPVSASQNSGLVIEEAIAAYLDRQPDDALAAMLESNLNQHLVADIATIANAALHAKGADHHAASVFFCVGARSLAVLPVGDCSVFLHTEAGATLYLSDSVRVQGARILPAEAAAEGDLEHFEEGVYLGQELRRFSTGDVIEVPLLSSCRVLACSDGLTEQLGLREVREFLEGRDFHQAALDAKLKAQPPRDDISALGFTVNLDRPREALIGAIPDASPPSAADRRGSSSSSPVPAVLWVRRTLGTLLAIALMMGLGLLIWYLGQRYVAEMNQKAAPILENPSQHAESDPESANAPEN